MSRIEAATLTHNPNGFELPNINLAKPLERITSSINIVKDGFLIGANRFLNRHTLKKVDQIEAALTGPLRETLINHYQQNLTKIEGIVRVSEESQEILFAIQGIGLEIDNARNKAGLLNRSERKRLEALAKRVARLDRDLKIDRSSAYVASRMKNILRDPVQSVDTGYNADQIGWGRSTATRRMPPVTGPVIPPSGPVTPPPPGRRPSLRSEIAAGFSRAKTRFESYSDARKVAVIAAGSLAITGVAALTGGLGYLGYLYLNKESRSVTATKVEKAPQSHLITELGMPNVELPGNINTVKYNEWQNFVKEDGNRNYKFKKINSADQQEYSVVGKAKAIAIDAMLKDAVFTDKLLADARVRPEIKELIKRLRGDNGKREVFDQNNPDHAGLLEMFTGKNPANSAFTEEYRLHVEMIVRGIVDETLKDRGITNLNDSNNPFTLRYTAGASYPDVIFDAKIGNGIILVPEKAVVDGTDQGYTKG